VRRDSGKEWVLQVHHDDGAAKNHIGLEPCSDAREDVGGASAGLSTGQLLSHDGKLIQGAYAVCVTQGNLSESAGASARTTRRGRRPWRVRTLLAWEPVDLGSDQPPYWTDLPWEGE